MTLYQQFFHFNTAPFSIAPDPHFIYMSKHHQEGLAHLLYGINQGGGFVALTGEVGTGKTTLCHCLLQQLPENIDIALILNPKLTAIELLATLCDELQISYEQNQQSLKTLIDSLNRHLLETHAAGKRTVLILDEAQNLSLDVLEQIRLLTNLETSKSKLLQIILIAQPELKLLLEQPELRQLNQRITARYHLSSLSLAETHTYIKHRLSISGGNANIFERKAINKIYQLSKGIPRLINIICDRALLAAYVENTHIVTKKITANAAKEVFDIPSKSALWYFNKPLLASFIIIALVIFIFNLKFITPKKKLIILSGSFEKTATIKENEQQHKILNFKISLEKTPQPLNSAIAQLANLWGKQINSDTDSNCHFIKSTGLQCLLDKSDWQALIALNRPVIMEFSRPSAEKKYVLLTGLKNGDPVFNFNPNRSFPVKNVLDLWDGYYLTLWQPPEPNITNLQSGQLSTAILWIRAHLAFTQKHSLSSSSGSNFFDSQLKTKIMQFQQQHQLVNDGIVGPKTFIHLSNLNAKNSTPKLSLIP